MYMESKKGGSSTEVLSLNFHFMLSYSKTCLFTTSRLIKVIILSHPFLIFILE